MNKHILITGGSRGIGAQTALLAAKQGYDVSITYKQASDAAEQLVQKINAMGGNAQAYRLDIAQADDIDRFFCLLENNKKPLNVFVNNAGIVNPIASFLEMTPERIQQTFNINVLGNIFCAQKAIAMMLNNPQEDKGCVINISSAASRLGSPNEFVDYAASKGAIDTLTLGLAKEFASHGIRVNAVRPGLIDTEIHASCGAPDRVERLASAIPMLRGGKASEVANTILWLASEEASYVTGALLDVSGGR